MPNFASDILVNVVRTKIDFYFVFVSCFDFCFSFSLVDDSSKCFRHFRHRFRRNWRKHWTGATSEVTTLRRDRNVHIIEPPAAPSCRVSYMFRSSTFSLSLFRPWLSGQWISAVPQRIATKFTHRIEVGSTLITYFWYFFSQTPKEFGEGKPQFSRTVVNWKCITSKRLNISTNEYQMFYLG